MSAPNELPRNQLISRRRSIRCVNASIARPLFGEGADELHDGLELVVGKLPFKRGHLSFSFLNGFGEIGVAELLHFIARQRFDLERFADRRVAAAIGPVAGSAFGLVKGRSVSGKCGSAPCQYERDEDQTGDSRHVFSYASRVESEVWNGHDWNHMRGRWWSRGPVRHAA